MLSIIQILTFFWIIRTSQQILFWIYLWQLKEYHIGRFIDHFRTHKGKKLIFGTLPVLKFILLAALLLSYYISSLKGLFGVVFIILLMFYIAEFLMFSLKLLIGKFKRPVFTVKAAFLTLVSFALIILYLSLSYKYINGDFWLVFYILLFDILVPLLVSLIVLFFQPLFVFLRNRVLKKAKNKIAKFNPPAGGLIVIGITGSYGKTSTKEFLTTILSKKFNVLSTEKNQNSEIGIAQCILKKLNDKHEIFIVEMGAYKKGGISLLCDMVSPKIGIVTGVNEQHLATFGSMENLLSAEGGRELADNLSRWQSHRGSSTESGPKDGLIVLNGDNKHCLNLYKQIAFSQKTPVVEQSPVVREISTTGQSSLRGKVYTLKRNKIDSDIWTEDIEVKKNTLSFIVVSKDGEMAHFNVNILGLQNIQNLLGAILVAKELGMSFDELGLALHNISQEQAGITLKSGVHGISIIDSSYSSNPDGVMADLDYLNIFNGKKVVVMPCLIELGRKSAEIHQQIGKKIAEVCDMAIITTKDHFKDIKTGTGMGEMPEGKVLLCDKPKEILNLITTFCKDGDAVLLEGRVPENLVKILVDSK